MLHCLRGRAALCVAMTRACDECESSESGKEEINLLNWTITCNLVYFWKHLLVMMVVACSLSISFHSIYLASILIFRFFYTTTREISPPAWSMWWLRLWTPTNSSFHWIFPNIQSILERRHRHSWSFWLLTFHHTLHSLSDCKYHRQSNAGSPSKPSSGAIISIS